MIVKQIWTNNDFRNFNYIIACPSTGEALAIDPLDYNKCLSVSKKNGFLAYEPNLEGCYFNFEKIDNYQHGIHDYFKYLKFVQFNNDK